MNPEIRDLPRQWAERIFTVFKFLQNSGMMMILLIINSIKQQCRLVVLKFERSWQQTRAPLPDYK